MDDQKKKIDSIVGEYQYGFVTPNEPVLKIDKGISEKVVKQISSIKKEPKWMTDLRMKAYKHFIEIDNPNWGPDLSHIDFNEITYYIKPTDRVVNDWDDVPEEIKKTFERLGIPQAERDYLSGVSTQFESEVVYQNSKEELDELGVVYLDTDTAL